MPALFRRRNFLSRSFEFWQRLGLHVTPVDYYQPIPDTRELDLSQPRAEAVLEGLDLDLPRQFEMLSRFRQDFQAEYEGTAALQANSAHGLEQATFVSIDPAATDAAPTPPVHLTCIEERAERLPLDTFDALDRTDILFIDSSHVVRSGGDVIFAILEVLPRLRPGVAVHFHDIFLPNDYPPEWITRLHRFWSEQYLLHGFLLFNGSFRVLWAGSCMHLRHRDELTGAFHSYDPQRHWPGSFWIERVR